MDDLNKQHNELDNINDLNLDDIDVDYDEENCVNCFYSDGHYCPLKQKNINRKIPICWSYRDCFTMRTSSDFQDDNDDFYEYEYINKENIL